jgi:hypothetical protein
MMMMMMMMMSRLYLMFSTMTINTLRSKRKRLQFENLTRSEVEMNGGVKSTRTFKSRVKLRLSRAFQPFCDEEVVVLGKTDQINLKVLLLGNSSDKWTLPIERLRSQCEYSALSMASRVAMAIPLLEVIHYIIQSFYISSQLMKRFNTTLHEDNQGALNMA